MKDLTGKKFGKWKVIGPSDEKGKYWCKCECGTVKDVLRNNLAGGKTSSCGCGKSTALGMSNTDEHRAWVNIKRTNMMCHEWREFENFFNDMGKCPSKDHRIGLIDKYEKYDKNNSRWMTKQEIFSLDTDNAPNKKRLKSKTEEYKTWGNVKRKAIPMRKLCDEWRSFDNFLRDVGKRPSKDHNIRLANPFGRYNKENARWMTKEEHYSLRPGVNGV